MVSIINSRVAIKGTKQGNSTSDVYFTTAHSGRNEDRFEEAPLKDGDTSSEKAWREIGPDFRFSLLCPSD